MKDKHHIPAVAKLPQMTERALVRLQAAALAIHNVADSVEKGDIRGFQAVSSNEGFAATIRHGKTLIEIQNDSFAVRQVD